MKELRFDTNENFHKAVIANKRRNPPFRIPADRDAPRCDNCNAEMYATPSNLTKWWCWFCGNIC